MFLVLQLLWNLAGSSGAWLLSTKQNFKATWMFWEMVPHFAKSYEKNTPNPPPWCMKTSLWKKRNTEQILNSPKIYAFDSIIAVLGQHWRNGSEAYFYIRVVDISKSQRKSGQVESEVNWHNEKNYKSVHSSDSKVHGGNMGPIWGQQVGPMLAPWTLLSWPFRLHKWLGIKL